MILFVLDLCGTFVFALTGALKAIRHKLDWLGILVLSAITGVGGGVLRDVILGSTPPAAFRNELYLISSLAAGVMAITLIPRLSTRISSHLEQIIPVGDAIGLGVFTLIGAAKGYEAEMGPVGIIFTGVVTSCGGGMIRDVLVREIPALLKRDFYATASLLGSSLFLLLQTLNLAFWITPVSVIFFTTALRLIAIKIRLSLPVPESR